MQTKLSKLQKEILMTIYENRYDIKTHRYAVYTGYDGSGQLCNRYTINRTLAKKFDGLTDRGALSNSYMAVISHSLRSLIKRGLIIGLHQTHIKHWKKRGRTFSGKYGYIHYHEYELHPVKTREYIDLVELTSEGEETVKEMKK